MRISKSLALVVAAAVIPATLALSTSAANAAPTKSDTVASATSQAISSNTGIPAGLKASIDKLDPYVSATPQGWVLNAPADVVASVPANDLATLQAKMQEMNSLAVQGIRNDGVVRPLGLSAHGPHGYIEQRWYGFELGIDNWVKNKLSGGLGLPTAGVTLMLAIGVVSGPLYVAGAAIAAGVIALMNVCQHQDGWTILFVIGGIPGQVVCNPFG